jgi:hypothetical protein
MNDLKQLILMSDEPLRISFVSGMHILRFRNGKWDISNSIAVSDFDYCRFALENGIAIVYRGYGHTHVLSSGNRLFYYRGTHDEAILYCLKHGLTVHG